MDWNNTNAGYVIAAYAISAISILGLVIWCLAKDRAAQAALMKIKELTGGF